MDGIKGKETRHGWHWTFGIAHYAMLHTIQANDVIPILPPAETWNRGKGRIEVQKLLQ